MPKNIKKLLEVYSNISEIINDKLKVLIDAKKRSHYDKYGSMEDEQFDFEDFMRHTDMDEMFNEMMGDIFGNVSYFNTSWAEVSGIYIDLKELKIKKRSWRKAMNGRTKMMKMKMLRYDFTIFYNFNK